MLQLKDDTARCEEEEAEKKVKLKAMREHHHKWEDTREGRVGTWRDFVKGKKTRVCLACCSYMGKLTDMMFSMIQRKCMLAARFPLAQGVNPGHLTDTLLHAST